MEKNKLIGIIVTVVVIAVIGAYFVGQSSNNNGLQSPAVSASATPDQTEINTTQVATPANNNEISQNNIPVNTQTSDSIFTRRQECAQKLSSFEEGIRTEYNRTFGSNNNIFLVNFVVGYSPSLQACIGGYGATSAPGGNFVGVSSQYSIINLDTNQAITGLPGESVGTFVEEEEPSYPNHHYQDYLNALSSLTDGQLH